MRSDQAPSASDLRLMEELPTGLALYDEDGALVEVNPAFLATAGLAEDQARTTNFFCLFGDKPSAFREPTATAVQRGDRHLTVSTRNVSGWGWLCQLNDVTSWVDAQAMAREVATHDSLTGLPNRSALLPKVERAVTDASQPTALLMIDLDRFKTVNDTLGHPIGDALLSKVADRLKASLRATDTVARLGGDEFAVLQVGAEQPGGAETLAKRLVEVLSRPYVIEGHMIDVGASIGVAIASASTASDGLFKQADIALYRAKEGGRGRYTFFEQHMDEAMQARRALEQDMRRALAFRQFELHYQPQMDIASRAVTGMEALLRWRHPTRGMVVPNDFIPLAEETGLIVPLGEWVVRQACEDAASWPEDVMIAVNVSAKQLASGKLVRAVEDALVRAGIAASRLEIEITESVLMSDVSGCVETLHRLRDLGTRVSMDDFGTGYSSLSYLSSFPFDKIKIDQSFVRGDDVAKNEAIVRAIAAIGKHLGMSTIAEGVETEAQMGMMALSGCGSVQGFLISRPVPAGEVAALFKALRAPQEPIVPASEMPAAAEATAAAQETNLYRLVYYSRNTIFGLDEEVTSSVDAILAASQRNNAEVGVTGALMFTDGFFAQVLEGAMDAVEQVFERIQLDYRHAEVRLLSFEPVEARVFPNWAMAFVGNDEAKQQKFGHYAASSGFDFTAVNADEMVAHLHRFLIVEEGSTLKIAA
ncbi:EAL domain-containing protein [Sphingomonas sp. CROZ-RG-20F-R02-07]|uniref:EAL domain-containing protein n=1 Tax=Sphingomonas sp. CROZ-RG-20F-R02-07 TaxID=2914832 RepID=UPI001F5A38F8|nr:EAL domain-containing protein [Sphingomonas sp. CROZ-RG-20F-R02-07]